MYWKKQTASLLGRWNTVWLTDCIQLAKLWHWSSSEANFICIFTRKLYQLRTLYTLITFVWLFPSWSAVRYYPVSWFLPLAPSITSHWNWHLDIKQKTETRKEKGAIYWNHGLGASLQSMGQLVKGVSSHPDSLLAITLITLQDLHFQYFLLVSHIIITFMPFIGLEWVHWDEYTMYEFQHTFSPLSRSPTGDHIILPWSRPWLLKSLNHGNFCILIAVAQRSKWFRACLVSFLMTRIQFQGT